MVPTRESKYYGNRTSYTKNILNKIISHLLIFQHNKIIITHNDINDNKLNSK